MFSEFFDGSVIVPIAMVIISIIILEKKGLEALLVSSICAWLLLLVFWGLLAIVIAILGGRIPDFGDAIITLRGVSDFAVASVWVIVPAIIIRLIKKAFKK